MEDKKTSEEEKANNSLGNLSREIRKNGIINLDDLKFNLRTQKNNINSGRSWDSDGTFNEGFLSPKIAERNLELLHDLTAKTRQLNETTLKLAKETKDKEKAISDYAEAKKDLDMLKTKMHVISRVSKEAQDKIYQSKEFYKLFADEKECDAVVVSIDIRRSTELMLKARTPKEFSKFITELSKRLSQCIIQNFGIFDKFTGDGILAFFPKFYSGEEAILRALKATEECHEIFREHYNNSRSAFNVFIKDVGLGIGIDYGIVTLVNTSNELTVVGIPVVYACRMSGAQAGDTLLNDAAKQEVVNLCADKIIIEETEINIKNEGLAAAYKIKVHPSTYIHMSLPDWIDINSNEEVLEKTPSKLTK